MSDLSSPERFHGLDALRGFALLLGVLLHASMSFLPGPYGVPVWITQDSQASGLFGLAFYVPHIFRMTLFFLLAGFFARLAYEKRGALGLAFDRAKRIALPLIAFWMPVFAGVITAAIWAVVKANGGAPLEPQEQPSLTASNFPLTHLWFLYLLCLFYPAAIVLRWIFSAIDKSGWIGTLMDRLSGFITATPLGLVILALPLTTAFLSAEQWMMWFGIPTPDTGLLPNPTALTGYGLAFGFGWILHRRTDLLNRLARLWIINLGTALALTVTCLVLIGITPSFDAAQSDLRGWGYALSYATAGWAWSLGLVGLAMTVFSRANAAVRYTANASYWIYILHLPIVMALQVLVNDWDVPGVLKLALIVGGTLVVTLGSYHLLVRGSWVGGWLNGRRYGAKAEARRMALNAESSPV